MLVGMQFAGLQERVDFAAAALVVASLVAATALVLRVVFRLSLPSAIGTGSPTNELVRHLMFVLLLTNNHEFNPGPVLILVFALHAVSMLAPFRMPFQIRSLTKSATAIGLVNIALVVAWLVPFATPVIAAGFICTYLYSFSSGTLEWAPEISGTGYDLRNLSESRVVRQHPMTIRVVIRHESGADLESGPDQPLAPPVVSESFPYRSSR